MYSLPSEHRYYKFIVGDSNIQILLHVEFLAFYCSDPFPLFLGTGSLQLYVLDQMWLLLLVLAHLAIAGYLLHRLVRLLTADADLQVLGSRLKPGYFNGRVVWITGASSGSEICNT